MGDLKQIIAKQESIIKEIIPEVKDKGECILYGMALSAVGNDIEKFKSILDNVEKLKLGMKGGEIGADLEKISYTILLAKNGNNLKEIVALEEQMQSYLGNYASNISPITRIAIAYIDNQENKKI